MPAIVLSFTLVIGVSGALKMGALAAILGVVVLRSATKMVMAR